MKDLKDAKNWPDEIKVKAMDLIIEKMIKNESRRRGGLFVTFSFTTVHHSEGDIICGMHTEAPFDDYLSKTEFLESWLVK